MVVGGILVAVALQTLLNLRAVPRFGRLDAAARAVRFSHLPRIAVLVPARNEAERISAAVRGWVAQDYPRYEVIVLDDDSRDRTAACAIVAGGSRVRVVRNDVLPAGWHGKPHACHRLRAETTADVLVFADADVRPEPGTLRATATALAALEADALSALPRHASASLAVRAMAGLQNWAPFALVPLWLARARRRPLFAVTNGQFLAIRAGAYDRAGGFAAVRDELGEDAAFGRRLVALGFRLVLVDGARLLACRPYRRARQVWNANVRNLRSAFLGSRTLLLAAAGVTLAVTFVPTAILALDVVAGRGVTLARTWLPLGELGLLLFSRVLTDRRTGYSGWLALLHPLALVATAAMAVTAACRRADVEWRDRRYAVVRRAA